MAPINLVIVIVILLILIACFTRAIGSYGVCTVEHMTAGKIAKPILWSYWELKPGKKVPPYITLCFKTFAYRCSGLFDIKILNEKTIYDFIPNLRSDLNQLGLAAKSDYIRVALLYYYGGVWLDADTIAMTDLSEVLDRLNEGWDFVGFGCTGQKCMGTGYPRPSNGAMASQKGGILMKNTIIELDNMLNSYFSREGEGRKELGYFDLGKVTIWREIDKLIRSQNYKYYHFPSYADGSRDASGNWVAPDLIFKGDIKLMDSDKLVIVFLANSLYCGSDPKYNWFCDLQEKDILEGPYFISSLFRRSLNYG
jgi:hypothetical protein